MSYTQVPAGAHGGPQSTVDRIVLHATVSPCAPGMAAGNARYLNQVGLSAHYLVDPLEVVQMLPEGTIGWHDGHNTDEVGIELCDPQAGDPARWFDADHQKMLALAAPLVAGIAARWHVPAVRIHAPLGTLRGICGHVDVTNTWHESTHQDPDQAGPFPWAAFIASLTQGDPPVTPAEITAVANQASDAVIQKLATAGVITEAGKPVSYRDFLVEIRNLAAAAASSAAGASKSADAALAAVKAAKPSAPGTPGTYPVTGSITLGGKV